MPPEEDKDKKANPGDVDEALWKKAEEQVAKEKGTTDGHWGEVSYIYEKMGGTFKKKNVPGKIDQPKWDEAKKKIEDKYGTTVDHYDEVVQVYRASGGKFHVPESKKNDATGPATKWYGLHMFPGVANYPESEEMVYISPETISEMNPTFTGKPVYVEHVDKVDYSKVDGYVSKSFFNAADGNTWCEFLATSDEAKQAIALGWKLSNAYDILQSGPAGLQVAAPYNRSITKASYDHLAIVPNPRYTQSIILSPEDFKKYNAAKESELKRLSNSEPAPKTRSISMLFDWFKKVKNESVDETSCVILPISKVEMTLTQLVNSADAEMEKAKLPRIAEDNHLVAVNGETCTVADLKKKHDESMNSLVAEKMAHAETKNALMKLAAQKGTPDETKEEQGEEAGKDKETEDKHEKESKEEEGKKGPNEEALDNEDEQEDTEGKEKKDLKSEEKSEDKEKKSFGKDEKPDGKSEKAPSKDGEKDDKKADSDKKNVVADPGQDPMKVDPGVKKAKAGAKDEKEDAKKNALKLQAEKTAKENFEKQKYAESLHNAEVKNAAPQIGTIVSAWELGKSRY